MAGTFHIQLFIRFAGLMRTLAVSLLLFLMAVRSDAQEYLAGVRGGYSFLDTSHFFVQTEAFAGANLPWDWNLLGSGFWLKPRVEISAGVLNNQDQEAFIGTAGPVLELRKGKFPVTLVGGVSPTFLSRHRFPSRDLGGRFEFTDHIGLDWYVTQSVTLGWQYHHMSNAGIYQKNPGLNLQMLSVSYRF